MGKSRKHILLLPALAAFLLLLAGCGIPTYFQTEKSYYEAMIDNSTDGAFTLGFTSRPGTSGDLSMLDAGGGPGLALFYYISDSPTERRDRLPSSFKDKYQGPNKIGISSGDFAKEDLFLQARSQDGGLLRNYGAFRLGPQVVQQAPDFALRLDARTPEGNIKYFFRLGAKDDGSIALSCRPNKPLGDAPASEVKKITLLRHNGGRFDSDDRSADDFLLAAEGEGRIYVHVYATLVFRGERFSNIFWTDPLYCGKVEFDPAT